MSLTLGRSTLRTSGVPLFPPLPSTPLLALLNRPVSRGIITGQTLRASVSLPAASASGGFWREPPSPVSWLRALSQQLIGFRTTRHVSGGFWHGASPPNLGQVPAHRLPEASGTRLPLRCHSGETSHGHPRGGLARCLPPSLLTNDSTRSEDLERAPREHPPDSTMASPALDVLTQGYQVMAVRGITSTTSLWLSPIRPTSTAADSAHTPGLRGFVRNPSAFVAPWISKDVASNVDDIGSLVPREPRTSWRRPRTSASRAPSW